MFEVNPTEEKLERVLFTCLPFRNKKSHGVMPTMVKTMVSRSMAKS